MLRQKLKILTLISFQTCVTYFLLWKTEFCYIITYFNIVLDLNEFKCMDKNSLTILQNIFWLSKWYHNFQVLRGWKNNNSDAYKPKHFTNCNLHSITCSSKVTTNIAPSIRRIFHADETTSKMTISASSPLFQTQWGVFETHFIYCETHQKVP